MSSQQSLFNQQGKHPRYPQKAQKATPIKPKSFPHAHLQTNGKNNTYLLKTILISKIDSRLELYPMLPPRKKKRPYATPNSSHWIRLEVVWF